MKEAPDKKIGSVMVVGGGIAGMQAALDLANSEFKVYLVEASPTIGGTMLHLDKTFPTNDCATCIGSPRLIETAKHPNIELWASTEVTGIEGSAGNYRVRVKKKARFITDQCTGCGDCAAVCPVVLPSEWDEGMRDRKAVYRSFAQAVPGAFLIEKKDRAPCVAACPAGVNVQGYVQLIGQGKYREAVRLIMERLPLPGVLGRVCPHPCEARCRRGEVDDALTIRELKRFAADRVDPDDLPFPDIEARPEKVAVIGAGPAGLTAAYYLRLKGYPVTIFEALPILGGMLRAGIPDYRLPPDILDREINHILKHGIEVRTGRRFGKDVTLADLEREEFRAVFLGIGAQAGTALHIPGETDFQGIHDAVSFLREVNLGNKDLPGKRAVIVGGGNVAVDAARTILRLGCEDVNILYRRTREEMPAYPEEIEEALEEGIQIRYLTAPLKILGAGGRVSGLECIRTEPGAPDESGRRRPVPVEGSEYVIDCDVVIPAVGQRIQPDWPATGPAPDMTSRGAIRVNPHTMQTSLPHVFAAGDAVSGPATVIEAVAAGRKAAEAIDRFVRGEDLECDAEAVTEEGAAGKDWRPIPEGLPRKKRARVLHRDAGERTLTFDEVNRGFSEEDACREAGRCLNCGACSECMECVRACKAGAVDHAMKDRDAEIEVGAVVLAPGFELTDPKLRPEFGYGRYPNVVTSLEFERILSAAGPYEGHIRRMSGGGDPLRIAWIQCVGSRDASIGKDYCSYACCMHAVKQTIIAKEHDHRIEPTVFFMDIRAQGKGFDRYYERARNESGVRFVRSMPSRVTEDPVTRNLQVHYIDEGGRFQDEEFDLVVLSAGLTPHRSTKALAELLDVSLDRFGFCRHRPLDLVATTREGIYACGVFQSPKDIPDSVVQAGGAAAEAMRLLSDVRGANVSEETYPEERDTLGEEPRIGVFICHCGNNIAGVVDVGGVAEYARTLPNVVYADHLLFTCSTDSTAAIKDTIERHRLNRVVVASCSPRTHEALFQDTIRKAGLNKYLFEMANIRDQCSWVHAGEPARATEKARDLVRMSVARSGLLEPIREIPFDVIRKGLVIGGGAAGMTAAINLADQGFEVTLVEKEDRLGGNANRLTLGPNGEDIRDFLEETLRTLESHPNITVLKGARVAETTGHIGKFRTRIASGEREYTIDHGAAIVATGAGEYRPEEYLYGIHPRVVTQRDFDGMLNAGNDLPPRAGNIVMIQCVGSRDEKRPYCSRVCCTQAVVNALRMKRSRPDAGVFILYRDMRTFGLYETLYKEAREAGIQFIRYEPDKKPVVTEKGGRLSVAVFDRNLNEEIVLPADLLVLSAAIIPQESSRELAAALKLPLDRDGFFLEAHIKLRPLDFANAGYFLCGLAHGPKFLDESIVQAKGAAARASAILSKKQMMAGGETAVVDRENCVVCLTCARTCPFGVPKVAEDGFIRIEPAECMGCGICVSACPRKVIQLRHMTDSQVVAKGMAVCGGVKQT